MTTKRVVWCVFVLLVIYFHLIVGTLLAIATAFYWLLEKRQSPAPAERLVCSLGNHVIGNEPYTFASEESGGEPICLRCIQRSKAETERIIKNAEERSRKEAEWNDLTEEEREHRRKTAKVNYCPKCDKLLNERGSCPMCFEFPKIPNAPMHKVKRILEWANMTDSEKRAREAEILAMRERNLSEWAIKDEDGVWWRKDNEMIVNSEDVFIQTLAVSKIWEVYRRRQESFEERCPWWGCTDMPPRPEEIQKALDEGREQKERNDHNQHLGDREWHVERIAYLVKNWDDDGHPVCMKHPISNMDLYNGAHRLLAALHLKKETIRAYEKMAGGARYLD